MYRSEPLQLVGTLQCHDHTDEKSDERNDRNGSDADRHCLMACTIKTQAGFQGRSKRINQCASQELRESAEVGQGLFCRGSNIEQRFHESVSVFQSMFFGVDYVKDAEEICEFQDVVDRSAQPVQDKIFVQIPGLLQNLDERGDAGAIDVSNFLH